MNGKLTISLGLKIRLLLIASILSAWYRVTHSPLSAFAEMLLVPPALYVSYILISVGYTFSSYTTYYKKRKWYIMYITRGSWATLIAWEEVTSKKQAWALPSFNQNFSWKSYFKMTEVISLLRKKNKKQNWIHPLDDVLCQVDLCFCDRSQCIFTIFLLLYPQNG